MGAGSKGLRCLQVEPVRQQVARQYFRVLQVPLLPSNSNAAWNRGPIGAPATGRSIPETIEVCTATCRVLRQFSNRSSKVGRVVREPVGHGRLVSFAVDVLLRIKEKVPAAAAQAIFEHQVKDIEVFGSQ